MEITCSFQKRTGGVCGLDKRYKNEVVVPLSSCDRDIGSHVLACSSVFSIPHDISSWTICPAHRSSLGIGL
jgi:hypothetical protein